MTMVSLGIEGFSFVQGKTQENIKNGDLWGISGVSKGGYEVAAAFLFNSP